jgi:hypothetical protein
MDWDVLERPSHRITLISERFPSLRSAESVGGRPEILTRGAEPTACPTYLGEALETFMPPGLRSSQSDEKQAWNSEMIT